MKALLLRGISWTAVSAAVITLAQVSQIGLATQIATAAEVGLYAIVMVVIGLLRMVVGEGLTAAVLHRQEISREELSSVYWLIVAAGMTLCIAALLAAPVISWAYQEASLTGLVVLGVASFAPVPLGLLHTTLLRKEMRFGVVAKIDIAAEIAGLAILGMAAWHGMGIKALLLGLLAANAVRSALLMACSGWSPLLLCRWQPYFVRFGLLQTGDRVVTFLVARADQLLIGALIGAEALGYYALAWYCVVQPVQRINPIFTQVFTPILAGLHDRRELRQGFLSLVATTAGIGGSVALVVATAAPVVVPFAVGAEWAPAVPAIQVLAVAALARAIGNPIGALVVAAGRPELALRWTLAGGAMQVPVLALAALTGSLEIMVGTVAALQCLNLIGVYLCVYRPIIRGTAVLAVP